MAEAAFGDSVIYLALPTNADDAAAVTSNYLVDEGLSDAAAISNLTAAVSHADLVEPAIEAVPTGDAWAYASDPNDARAFGQNSAAAVLFEKDIPTGSEIRERLTVLPTDGTAKSVVEGIGTYDSTAGVWTVTYTRNGEAAGTNTFAGTDAAAPPGCSSAVGECRAADGISLGLITLIGCGIVGDAVGPEGGVAAGLICGAILGTGAALVPQRNCDAIESVCRGVLPEYVQLTSGECSSATTCTYGGAGASPSPLSTSEGRIDYLYAVDGVTIGTSSFQTLDNKWIEATIDITGYRTYRTSGNITVTYRSTYACLAQAVDFDLAITWNTGLVSDDTRYVAKQSASC